MKAAEIREKYVNFFASKGHDIMPSASLVPHNDPTLLWINAGMAPLKKYFDGTEIPKNPRMTNAQKCIRTNDIENVGKTARHQTFFEMLGNFSIGDYFKREAIHWAYEFLTETIGFDPSRLSVTIHPEDEEAFQIWNEEKGMPAERIVRLEDNFWDIGEGPCGPCSEIFYDTGKPGCGEPSCQAGCDCDRYLEVWNLVFSQFNHQSDGTYTPLPKKNIDTGMGLERMTMILQNVETNFDTDLFQPIIQKIAQLSGRPYHQNLQDDIAMKVIADHVRTVAFSVGDGALPSNEGRGYVIRRLLRRAVRYGRVLGIHRPFLHELVSIVGSIMGSYYPEVLSKQSFIERVIRSEEERFSETLQDGEALLAAVIAEVKAAGRTSISGPEAFRLYDTYGFPADLTEDIAAEHGLAVDREGFEQSLNEQRERARNSRKEAKSMQAQTAVWEGLALQSRFVGYSEWVAEARILRMTVDGTLAESAQEGDDVQFVLNITPFYAESGGQVSDRGIVSVMEQGQLQVYDVQKMAGGLHIHFAKVISGEVAAGAVVQVSIDLDYRNAIIKNHTATHLLQKALREVLGEHVTQAGSLVQDGRLRFDFSHLSAMTAEEIQSVEERVNQQIWKNIPVAIQELPIEEAKKLGAMALFGEKYGDVVRVVSAGDYSIELCGGCHVHSTDQIGQFRIVSETSIASGVRRMEAVTGKAAYEYALEQSRLLEEVAGKIKANVKDVPQRVELLQGQLRENGKEIDALRSRLANFEVKKLLDEVRYQGEIPYITAELAGYDSEGLRRVAEELRNRLTSGIVVLASWTEGKVSFVTAVTQDMIAKGHQAGKIVKSVSAITGGGGGGRPELAQAGGKDPSKIAAALAAVPDLLS